MNRGPSRRIVLASVLLAPGIRLIGGIAGLSLAGPAHAAPARYTLDAARSLVRFETSFGPDIITGDMPVKAADLTLDFANVANCRVLVRLDVAHARASFPFAAQAMKGPKVLDSTGYPEILFKSTMVRRNGDGARVSGDMTIKGVTRPVTLDAAFYRQKGTAAGDLNHLSIRLTGLVRRSDYGAIGWSDMVSDEVRLDILARIDRAE
ncbi:MAG: YceI family protein [Proteobacteria bacterium]|nr:YceI family protein [Pseudomonadota bacterium]